MKGKTSKATNKMGINYIVSPIIIKNLQEQKCGTNFFIFNYNKQ